MSSENFEDPKIALTFSLLKQMDYITARFNAFEEEDGPDKETVRISLAMATLLRRIVIDDDDKEMVELKKTITLTNYDTIQHAYIFKAYDIICNYMNNTYFADYHKAKPKFKTEGHI